VSEVPGAATDLSGPELSEEVNALRLVGEVWRIRYGGGGEAGDFHDRSGSALRHLARLLAEPNRRFRALEFYPPPASAAQLPRLVRPRPRGH
jgi:hypothetical protein